MKGHAHHAARLSIDELNGSINNAYALACKYWIPEAAWAVEHLPELRTCHPVDVIVVIQEKHSEGKAQSLVLFFHYPWSTIRLIALLAFADARARYLRYHASVRWMESRRWLRDLR
jgi:hypothetical protein